MKDKKSYFKEQIGSSLLSAVLGVAAVSAAGLIITENLSKSKKSAKGLATKDYADDSLLFLTNKIDCGMTFSPENGFESIEQCDGRAMQGLAVDGSVVLPIDENFSPLSNFRPRDTNLYRLKCGIKYEKKGLILEYKTSRTSSNFRQLYVEGSKICPEFFSSGSAASAAACGTGFIRKIDNGVVSCASMNTACVDLQAQILRGVNVITGAAGEPASDSEVTRPLGALCLPFPKCDAGKYPTGMTNEAEFICEDLPPRTCKAGQTTELVSTKKINWPETPGSGSSSQVCPDNPARFQNRLCVFTANYFPRWDDPTGNCTVVPPSPPATNCLADETIEPVSRKAINWPDTLVGATVTQNCPDYILAQRSRTCNAGPLWGAPSGDCSPPVVGPPPLPPGPLPNVQTLTVDFTLTGQPQVNDYLFVVDNSYSMSPIIGRMRNGFKSLMGTFPLDSKIAVMTMAPADPNNLGRAGPWVPKYNGAAGVVWREPGFIDLVSKARINSYRPYFQGNWKINDGCGRWFLPEETGPGSGRYCIDLHTQVSLVSFWAEAGIYAFNQMLIKNTRDGIQVFRNNATVHVTFISDTHDPGNGIKNYVPASLSELKAQIETNTPSYSRVYFHAVTSQSANATCGEGWFDGSYLKLVSATGGRTLTCKASDYTSLFTGLVDDGKEKIYSFDLTNTVKSILSVTLDGKAFKRYSVKNGKISLALKPPSSSQIYQIKITYSP